MPPALPPVPPTARARRAPSRRNCLAGGGHGRAPLPAPALRAEVPTRMRSHPRSALPSSGGYASASSPAPPREGSGALLERAASGSVRPATSPAPRRRSAPARSAVLIPHTRSPFPGGRQETPVAPPPCSFAGASRPRSRAPVAPPPSKLRLQRSVMVGLYRKANWRKIPHAFCHR